MRNFLKLLLVVCLLGFSSSVLFAQTGQTDPDIFANKQNYTAAPHFVRSAVFERGHVPDHWPFIADRGEIVCITVDGVALAFFETPNAPEPYMLGENMVITFIGSMITGINGYVAKDYDTSKLIVDLEKTYTAALIQCGPPYAQ